MAKTFTAAPEHIAAINEQLRKARNSCTLAKTRLAEATNCERWSGIGVNNIREFIDLAENDTKALIENIQHVLDGLSWTAGQVSAIMPVIEQAEFDVANDLSELIFDGVAVSNWRP